MTRHNQRVRRPPNPALPPVSAARAPAPSQPHFILRGLGNGPCPNFRPRLWPHCFGWWPHIMPVPERMRTAESTAVLIDMCGLCILVEPGPVWVRGAGSRWDTFEEIAA